MTLQEKEDELQHLRQCLSQLTDQVAESATDGDEGISEGERERKLTKIKAMLDTSKVCSVNKGWYNVMASITPSYYSVTV